MFGVVVRETVCEASGATLSAGVESMSDMADEWMYVLQQKEDDQSAAFNKCFEALDRGDLAQCRVSFDDATRSSSAAFAPWPLTAVRCPTTPTRGCGT